MRTTFKTILKSFLPRLNGFHLLLMFMLGYTILIGPLTVSTMLLIVVFGLAYEFLTALKETVEQHEGKDGDVYIPGMGWLNKPDPTPAESKEDQKEPLTKSTDVDFDKGNEEDESLRRRNK